MPPAQAAVAVQYTPILGLALAGILLLAFRAGGDLLIRYTLQRRGIIARETLPRKAVNTTLGLAAHLALGTALALTLVLLPLSPGTVQ